MFYITVSNGLMKDGHRKRMGEAVWEFMWLLDKITLIDEEGVGWVLGKKPINLDNIAKDHGVHRETISRNLIKLEKEGYILKRRTPYGIAIGIHKAKKRFNKNTESNSTQMRNLRHGNVESNKTVSVDNISKTGREAPPSPKEFFENKEQQELIINWLVQKGASPEMAALELKKFIDYWTELSKSGHKQRWESQSFFDIRRRLVTWMRNASEFNKSKNKGSRIINAI